MAFTSLGLVVSLVCLALSVYAMFELGSLSKSQSRDDAYWRRIQVIASSFSFIYFCFSYGKKFNLKTETIEFLDTLLGTFVLAISLYIVKCAIDQSRNKKQAEVPEDETSPRS